MERPIPLVACERRAKVRSSTARRFHKLAYTPLMAQWTVFGLTFDLVTAPSASVSMRHEPSGLSTLSGSAEKLS